MDIGKLEQVALRAIWPNEALGFTVWLADNLDFLGEAVDLQLSLVRREASAGPFSADIVAEDGTGNTVIIENQLERTDHDHLGKLVTYLSNLDAKIAIWISSDPRPEHETAIHWLNESLPADTAFYLLKLGAYRIGDSLPAPHLSLIAGPTPEAKEIGSQKKEMAQRHVLRLEFWEQLLDKAKRHTSLHANISPSKENWVSTGAGVSGLALSYVIRMNDAQVELYIDRCDKEENKGIYDELLAGKERVEQAFGGPLDWQRLDERRASRVRFVLDDAGLRSGEGWTQIQDAMIGAMVRLEKAFKPEIQRLRI